MADRDTAAGEKTFMLMQIPVHSAKRDSNWAQFFYWTLDF